MKNIRAILRKFTSKPTEEEIKKREEKNKEQDRKLYIIAGKITRPILLISLILYLYFSASSSVANTFNSSLASLTLGGIFGAISFIFLEIFLFIWLLKGSDDDTYETIWGPLGGGLVSILLLVILWFFFKK